jgi:hypothetical protein
MGKSLCDIALSDLKIIVIALLDLLAMCPTRGTKVKSSLEAHWNLTVSTALFLMEKLSLFYSLMIQSPKETLSSSSDGKFSNRISSVYASPSILNRMDSNWFNKVFAVISQNLTPGSFGLN